MIEVAETLSKPFPFVKIDLYNINGKILLSELTFIPCGGLHPTKHANLPSNIQFKDIPKHYC